MDRNTQIDHVQVQRTQNSLLRPNITIFFTFMECSSHILRFPWLNRLWKEFHKNYSVFFLRLKIYLRVPRLSRSPRSPPPAPPWAPPAPRWWPEGSLSTVLFLSTVEVLVDFIVPLRDCRSSKVEKLASSRLLASSNLICLAWSEKIWRSNMIIVKMEIEKAFFSIWYLLSLDGHIDERNYDKDGYYFYAWCSNC